MQRLFIAFPIPREAAREVERVQRKLEEQNPRAPITWTRTQSHCTLVFLGDCDEATTALLKDKLPTLAGSGAIPAQLGSADAFPNPHRPRVLIIRIDDSARWIVELYEKVKQTVGDCGIELDPGSRQGRVRDDKEKPFIPHVTLGRVKQDGARVRGFDTIAVAPVAFEVSEVVLFASELLPQGPRHMALTNVMLSAAKHPVG